MSGMRGDRRCDERGCKVVAYVSDIPVMGEFGGDFCFAHRERADLRCVRIHDGQREMDDGATVLPDPQPLPRQEGAEDEYPRHPGFSLAMQPHLPAGWVLWQDSPEDEGKRERGKDCGAYLKIDGKFAARVHVTRDSHGQPDMVFAHVGAKQRMADVRSGDVVAALKAAIAWCVERLPKAPA